MTERRSTRIEKLLAETRGLDRDRELLQEAAQILRRLEDAGPEFHVANLVSNRTGKGMLDIAWLGQVAQVTPEKARELAWMLLEAAAVAESEAAVMRFMRERVGLNAEKAAMMLVDFRRYRDEEPGSLLGQEVQ